MATIIRGWDIPVAPTASDLTAFLKSKSGVPFQWGVADCCLFVADWVHEVNGTDPAADLRGTYATKTRAYRVMTQQGGLDQIMTRSGWSKTTTPSEGDIGIIGDLPRLPGIYVGPGWYFKSSTIGLAYITDPMVGCIWARP